MGWLLEIQADCMYKDLNQIDTSKISQGKV